MRDRLEALLPAAFAALLGCGPPDRVLVQEPPDSGPMDGASMDGASMDGSANVACSDEGSTPSELVTITSPLGGTYGIERTEVTTRQYCAWLKSGPQPSTAGLPERCAWKKDFPLPSGVTNTPNDLPVQWADWCDAFAYCKWLGRRLCGRIGGGSLAVASVFDADQSQWQNACSSGGAHKYPYGDVYDSNKCNYGMSVAEVGSKPQCQSTEPGYTGVLDLDGNLAEWEDACDEDPNSNGQTDTCRARGTTGVGLEPKQRTDGCLADQVSQRSGGGRGFRCCSEP